MILVASFVTVALFTLMSHVTAETGRKFESFVANFEEITQINSDCKQTVKECKEKAALVSNFTDKIKALEETNANLTNKMQLLEAKNADLETTLTSMQGMLHLHLIYC